MRIACISTSQVPSKTANSIQLMKACSALAELGHDVRLWILGSDPEMEWADLARHYGVKNRFAVKWVADFPWPRGWWYSLRAVRAARRWRADLYYVWPYQAAALASGMGLPTLLELHDRPHGRMGPVLFRRFLRGSGARRIASTTTALLEWVQERYGELILLPSTVVAPNGVDLDRYLDLPAAEDARRLLDLPEQLTAGYTGHLYRGRGLDLMVELAKRHPEVSFLWVGGEESAVEQWRARFEERELENVRLLGFVPNDEMPMVQASCDVLLMPYEEHIEVSSGGDTVDFASPMKVFEYLAAGRAILASDLPVIREILNESNSVLLPPGDVDSWAGAMETLMSDPGQRNWLAAHAKEDALQYSWVTRAGRVLEGLELD
jgi:glycosyltransferase involved in cell wall biosynthesis